jgi:hypothetical protein
MPSATNSIEQAAEQITRDDHSWSGALGTAAGPITFAFRATGTGSENEGTFSRFGADQIVAAQEALGLWSDIANISFVRNFGSSGFPAYSDSATILFAKQLSAGDGAPLMQLVRRTRIRLSGRRRLGQPGLLSNANVSLAATAS